nr:MAG TPA: hypothetical protein [Caudoviricetes sp.]
MFLRLRPLYGSGKGYGKPLKCCSYGLPLVQFQALS